VEEIRDPRQLARGRNCLAERRNRFESSENVWIRAGMRRAPRCRAMNARRSTVRLVLMLVGESFREIAVLVVVFAPLDVLAQSKPLTLRFMAATMAYSVCCSESV